MVAHTPCTALSTLIMFPVMTMMYVRLARFDERSAAEQFGNEYRRYKGKTPAFFSWDQSTLCKILEYRKSRVKGATDMSKTHSTLCSLPPTAWKLLSLITIPAAATLFISAVGQ